jgi:hypothetical protein
VLWTFSNSGLSRFHSLNVDHVTDYCQIMYELMKTDLGDYFKYPSGSILEVKTLHPLGVKLRFFAMLTL